MKASAFILKSSYSDIDRDYSITDIVFVTSKDIGFLLKKVNIMEEIIKKHICDTNEDEYDPEKRVSSEDIKKLKKELGDSVFSDAIVKFFKNKKPFNIDSGESGQWDHKFHIEECEILI